MPWKPSFPQLDRVSWTRRAQCLQTRRASCWYVIRSKEMYAPAKQNMLLTAGSCRLPDHMLVKRSLTFRRARRMLLFTAPPSSLPWSQRYPKRLCMSTRGSNRSKPKGTSFMSHSPTESPRLLTPSLAPMASSDQCASTFSRTVLQPTPQRLPDSGTADT